MTESGKIISLICEQFANASPPIDFTPYSTVIYFNLAHPLKLPTPTLWTSALKVNVERFAQFANELCAISPAVTCNTSSELLSIKGATIAGIVALAILVQSAKASEPMVARFFDTVTSVKEVQPAKALAPILVTVSGIITDWIEVLSLNASSLMATTVPLL